MEPRSGELASQRHEIAAQKNRAIIPALKALADELEERAKSGKLKEELAGMKAGQLIGQMTRIVAALKESAPIVVVPAPVPPADPTWLNAHSSATLSESEKAERRRKAIEGEKA